MSSLGSKSGPAQELDELAPRVLYGRPTRGVWLAVFLLCLVGLVIQFVGSLVLVKQLSENTVQTTWLWQLSRPPHTLGNMITWFALAPWLSLVVTPLTLAACIIAYCRNTRRRIPYWVVLLFGTGFTMIMLRVLSLSMLVLGDGSKLLPKVPQGQITAPESFAVTLLHSLPAIIVVFVLLIDWIEELNSREEMPPHWRIDR